MNDFKSGDEGVIAYKSSNPFEFFHILNSKECEEQDMFGTLIFPEEKKINNQTNPPQLIVEFFQEQKNIKNITCYSNDGGEWKKTSLDFENNQMNVKFEEKFLPRRGRINCSLNEDGKWRWFGTQFTIKN